MKQLRKLTVSGTPYEMGYQHGLAYAKEIAELTEERVHLATVPFWNGGQVGVTRAEVLALGRRCLAIHEQWCPELVEEMRGMAAATGLGVNELVIMNGFTDFVDLVANPAALAELRNGAAPAEQSGDDGLIGGCTSFVVREPATRDGRNYLGQTWDMHSSATPYVMLLDVQPADGPALLTFTITGCVGMIGMNEHGICVGINNLLAANGRAGVHWVYVVRRMLAQRTVEEALAQLTGAPLSGAHNFTLLGPGAQGGYQGYNIEHMATHFHVTPVDDVLAHTNHCAVADMVAIERQRKQLSLESTTTRQAQANRFFAAQRGQLDVAALMALTRYAEEGQMSICAYARPDYDVETSGACIMSPETGQLWALWGTPRENEYFEYQVGEGVPAAEPAAVQAGRP
jgi:isopenicillin-N N-acyltransferase-like protein